MANSDYVEKERIRRKRREEKRRRERRKRSLLCICIFFVLFLTVLLAFKERGLLKSDGSMQAKAFSEGSVVPAVSTAPESLEAEGRETAQARHIWAEVPRLGVSYEIHPVSAGWSQAYLDNTCAMAPAASYLTAIKIAIPSSEGGTARPEGTVEYSVNLSGFGWLDWVDSSGKGGEGGEAEQSSDDAESLAGEEEGSPAEAGDSSGSAALEAMKVQLTGELAEYYDILYCVLQDSQWTAWVKNGEEAGVSGKGLHMDGIRISLVRKKSGEAVYAGEIDISKPMVAVTYDDGPSKRATARILDKLQEHGAHATFFMVGQQVEKTPEVLNRMVQQGCEVANHTYNHISMNKLQPSELEDQISRNSQLIFETCGVRPVVMRPVGGNENDMGLELLASLGMPAILWSIDTLDWKTRDPATTFQRACENVKDGDIILMHDLYDQTGEASMTIIDELINRGFQLVTISEMSAYRGGLLPGKSYTSFRQ